MLSNVILNLFASIIALSLSSGVALHDSRLDKVFATIAAPASDTSQHDVGQAMSHELHIHSGSQTLADATGSDPGTKARTHRKHTALAHTRVRLSALTA